MRAHTHMHLTTQMLCSRGVRHSRPEVGPRARGARAAGLRATWEGGSTLPSATMNGLPDLCVARTCCYQSVSVLLSWNAASGACANVSEQV